MESKLKCRTFPLPQSRSIRLHTASQMLWMFPPGSTRPRRTIFALSCELLSAKLTASARRTASTTAAKRANGSSGKKAKSKRARAEETEAQAQPVKPKSRSRKAEATNGLGDALSHAYEKSRLQALRSRVSRPGAGFFLHLRKPSAPIANAAQPIINENPPSGTIPALELKPSATCA